MTIKLLVIGKTNHAYFTEAEQEYLKRLKKYIKVEYSVIPDLKKVKNLSAELIKRKEAELLLKKILPQEEVVLLDEKGKQHTSVGFSEWMQQKMNLGKKSLCFVVGGAYGFDESMYQKFPQKISLSKMTFSHQMIRTFLLEQIYRAFSILNNEPYHNE